MSRARPESLDRTLDRRLYYMTPIENVGSITARGILSYDAAMRLRKCPESFADRGVNRRRDDLILEGRRLHSFVPLYWATHTPMQYVITVKRPCVDQRDLIFIEVDNRVIDREGTWTSDGNATSSETLFYPGRAGSSMIDWQIVDTPNCYWPEYKRKKAAEVLVPDKVPVRYISRICVVSVGTRTRVRRELNAVMQARVRKPRLPPIEVMPEFYY